MNDATPDIPGEFPLRTRVIAHIHVRSCEDSAVTIDHVYEPDGVETCHCGNPTHDPGMVAMAIHDEDGMAAVLITAEEALLIANRLQRAASLVLESLEDVPDVEREAARLTGGAA